MKKKLFAVMAMFLALFGISGCGNSNEGSDACATNDLKIVFVTDIGGVHDESFNQGAWEGLQEVCSQLGAGAKYIETKSEDDFEGNLRKAAEEAQIVVTSGSSLEQGVGTVAQEFPDVNFVFIDGQPKDKSGNVMELPNVYSFLFNEAQAGYLVGYIAAKLTKTGTIGFLGGLEIPAVQKFGWGYLQGAQAANPNVNVQYQYANSFTDATAGKNYTNTMISTGADIIFTAAGGVNKGAIEAAISSTEAGQPIWIIGVDRNMYNEGLYDNDTKSVILTSAIKNVSKAVFTGCQELLSGQTPAQVQVLGYEQDYVGIPADNPNLADQQSVIDEAKASLNQAISSGSLQNTKDGMQGIITINVNGAY